MAAVTSPAILIDCEIVAARALVSDLSAIAHACAHDVSLCLAVRKHAIPASDPMITFFVSADTVLREAAVWSLAGRVACFCPQARVAVHVAAPVADAGGTLVAEASLQTADAA